MPRVQLSSTKKYLVVFSTIVVFLCSFFLVTNAAAVDSLSYSGRLVQTNGAPVSGDVNLLIELGYATSPTAGTVVCSQNFSSVALSNGVFHLKLNLCTGTLADVLANVPDEKYAAIRVTNLSAVPVKVYNFQELNSMPFANIAGTAKQLVQMTATPGQVLEWNGAKWWPKTLGAGTVTSVTSGGLPVRVSSGVAPVISIDQAGEFSSGYLSADDWKAFNTKESITAGLSNQYYRGDKTWQTLKTDAVPEAGSLTNLYFTNSRALGVPLAGFVANPSASTIVATDTMLQAFAKTQGQIDTLSTAGSSYLKKNSATGESITGVVNVGTIGSLNLTYTPINATDAVNKIYTDAGDALRVNKSGDTMSGALTLNSDLIFKNGTHTVTISGDPAATATYSLTLPPAAGAAGNVLKTDAAGKLSWADLSTATTVTTNANMTGPITSVGNATSVNSQTGTGSTFVMSASPTITTPTFSGIATGSISGNAETVTTNANMTGPITSVGNATSVASQTGTGSIFVMSASPTITTPTFSGVAIGSISGNAETVTTNANLTGDVTSVGNATTLANDSVTDAKILNSTITLAKLNGTSDSTKYLRGDKTWSPLAADVINSVLGAITPDTGARTDGDNILTAFNKTQGQLNTIAQGYVSKNGTNLLTGVSSVQGLTARLTVPTPLVTDLSDATNVQYVSTALTNALSGLAVWDKNANDINYTAGNVGIGTTGIHTVKLEVAGEIKVGNALTPCSAVSEGAIRYNSATKKMEYCNGTIWRGFIDDTTPDNFNFTNQTLVSPLSVVTSNAATVSGFDGSLTATCIGCTIDRNSSGTFSAILSGFIPGDTIRLRMTASATGNTLVTSSVTLGSTSSSWDVTTSDNTPNAFSFTNQSGVSFSNVITSNSVTLSAFDGPLTASCTGCTLDRNSSGSFSSSVSGFMPGDTIRVRLTSSAIANTAVTASVTIGSVTSSTWSVTTKTLFTVGYNSITPTPGQSNPCEYGIYCSTTSITGSSSTCTDVRFTRLAGWSNPSYKLMSRVTSINASVLAFIANSIGAISCSATDKGTTFLGYHDVNLGGGQPAGYALSSSTPLTCATGGTAMGLYDGSTGTWGYTSPPSSCQTAPAPYINECNWASASYDKGFDITCSY